MGAPGEARGQLCHPALCSGRGPSRAAFCVCYDLPLLISSDLVFRHQYISSACPKRLSPAKHPSSTMVDTMNTTGPGYRVIGANTQTTPATQAMPLSTLRIARFASELPTPIGSATKLYPQSQRSAVSGFATSHSGHSFIAKNILRTRYRSKCFSGTTPPVAQGCFEPEAFPQLTATHDY